MRLQDIRYWPLIIIMVPIFAGCGLFDEDGMDTTTPELDTDFWESTRITETVSEVLQLSDGNIYLSDGEQLVKASDPTNEWAPVSTPFTAIYDLDKSTTNDRLFAVTDSGLYEQESDETWNRLFNREDLVQMTVPESGNLVVADLRGRLYQSTDKGVNWSGPDTVVAQTTVSMLSTLPNGNIMVSFSHGGVWESVNDSLAFEQTSLQTETLLDIDGTEEGGFFAASANQALLIKPVNTGVWSARAPENQPNRRGLAVWSSKQSNGPPLVLLSIEGSGIYGTVDEGVSWYSFNDPELPATSLDITSIQLPDGDMRLLLATGEGLWISRMSGASFVEAIPQR